jgi:Uma2 family endonuclease
MALQRDHWISVEEYLAIDRASPDVKYEYMDGHMYAMSGGTMDHAEIAANLFFLLRRYLQGKLCRAFSSDVRVRVAEKKYYYPDVTVSCTPEDWQQGTNDIVQTPRLVVEVLSPSTENFDRSKKFRTYQACPSIEEYVLINTTHQTVETYRRQGKIWAYQPFGPGQQVELVSIGFTLPIKDLYLNTDVPEREVEGDCTQ